MRPNICFGSRHYLNHRFVGTSTEAPLRFESVIKAQEPRETRYDELCSTALHVHLRSILLCCSVSSSHLCQKLFQNFNVDRNCWRQLRELITYHDIKRPGQCLIYSGIINADACLWDIDSTHCIVSWRASLLSFHAHHGTVSSGTTSVYDYCQSNSHAAKHSELQTRRPGHDRKLTTFNTSASRVISTLMQALLTSQGEALVLML